MPIKFAAKQSSTVYTIGPQSLGIGQRSDVPVHRVRSKRKKRSFKLVIKRLNQSFGIDPASEIVFGARDVLFSFLSIFL